ncbi:alginate lyase family protein [uncultured Deefgea sp.]|uniref:heparinase II/III family protein n=1 Tax=uncultured Deefgea sp. TaxID=1304914 RepID=UPI0025936940|nr:alginate lyase family protein [uncultured Deefgea sp.]
MATLDWYMNRLRCMSLPEVLHRVAAHSRKLLQEKGLLLAHSKAPERVVATAPWIQKPEHLSSDECAAILNSAAHLLAGRWDVFGQRLPLGMPPDWQVDPLTGIRAPFSFGLRLAISQRNVVGDIKYLWEPARHLELVTLAQAWVLTQDLRYISALQDCFASWLKDAPYPNGPHWSSSLETAIRLINWSIIWQLVGQDDSALWAGEVGHKLKSDWLAHIYQSLFFIRHHLSQHSSANNHLIGELSGLLVACMTWPFWAECSQWRDFAKDNLLKQALLQNGVDGVNREQAMSYQQFVFEFLFWAGRSVEATPYAFSADYWERLYAMGEWVAAVRDVAGNVPSIGDADDGYVTQLARDSATSPFDHLLQVCGEIFGCAPWQTLGCHSAAAKWWLSFPLSKPKRNANLLAVPRLFAEGGYAVIGSDWGMPSEVKLTLDSGPLGYLGIAAHGHADALAILLSVGGMPVLVDSGTYSYHAEGGWRDYFRGTAAHNTVCINGQDQSVSGGKFMWVKQAKSVLHDFTFGDGLTTWCASQDGYQRLESKVAHLRRVEYSHAEQIVRVFDEIDAASPCSISINWQHAPDLEVVCADAGWAIRSPKFNIVATVSGADFSLIAQRGALSPIAGWVSERYGEKQPATRLDCRIANHVGKSIWITEFKIEFLEIG